MIRRPNFKSRQGNSAEVYDFGTNVSGSVAGELSFKFAKRAPQTRGSGTVHLRSPPQGLHHEDCGLGARWLSVRARPGGVLAAHGADFCGMQRARGAKCATTGGVFQNVCRS
eukprot:scaffold1596_cov302-Pinguiococcus_pyrenoidosus.AAC.43